MILCKIGYQEFLIDEQYAALFAQMMSNIMPISDEYIKGEAYPVESEYKSVTMEKCTKDWMTREEYKLFKDEVIDPPKSIDDDIQF